MSSESPPASKIAPNGDPYSALLFLDFNAMYLWSQEQAMPLGPGLHWTKMDYGFKKQVLQQQTSFSALQWLQYEQTKYKVDCKLIQFIQLYTLLTYTIHTIVYIVNLYNS